MSDLTQQELKDLLSYDPVSGEFTWLKSISKRIRIGDSAGYSNSNLDSYVFIRIFGTLYRAHRLAWLYVYGKWPDEDIDHIDRNKRNNAIANLREATDSQNLFNASVRSDNSSGVKGVSFSRRDCVWRAYINVSGKHRSLGNFKTKDEAACARKLGEAAHEQAVYMK